MKPFNLKEYLKDPSRKIVTRDGRSVRIICTDCRMKLFPIVGLLCLDNDNDEEEIISYNEDGRYFMSSADSERDLFFAPEKKEGWINIYKYTTLTQHSSIVADRSYVYSSKQDAFYSKDDKGYIDTIKIEWEE